MAPRTTVVLSFFASAALVATTALAQPPAQGGRKFTTTMTGAQEVSAAFPTGGAGDPDGTGTASISVNHGQARVCWDLTVNNIATPTRAHIHRAPALANGPIVVDFFNATPTTLSGCTSTTQPINQAVLKDIIQNPQNYYVNVHNATFPAGAIRGQLAK